MSPMESQGARKSVLVVDDEVGYRDLFSHILTAMGFDVHSASDGLMGLDLVRQRNFVIVFLDIHMPPISGHEILRRIRELKQQQKVVVMSSNSDASLSSEMAEGKLGAVGCLYKPFEVEKVLKIMADLRD